MSAQVATLAGLRTPQNESSMAVIAPGFGSLQSFELMQRQAKLLCSSSMVPATYRSVIVKTDYKGNIKSQTENPNALSNCVIALNMATRMNADPLMVMQNLYLVEGRPSWSSQWIIAMVNNCGRFSPLRFALRDIGKRVIEYVTFEWENNERTRKVQRVEIHDKECIAWVVEKGSEEKLYGPPVSIGMAVAEGWYTKNGSKWQTMDEVMFCYRVASFFGKLYAPELLMGLPSREEVEDTIEMEYQPDGSIAMAAAPETIESMRQAKASEEKPAPATALTHSEPETIPQQTRQAEAEPVLRQENQQQRADDTAQAGFGDFQPTEEEIARIHAREMQEEALALRAAAGKPADAPAATRTRPARNTYNVE